jgi:hypothetical protein
VTEPKRFLILSDSRSGTSLLSETLNIHPQIVCHGEVFHPTPASHIKGDLSGTSIDNLLNLRDRDTADFLLWVYGQDGARAVGFKMWRSQNEVACDALMHDPTVLKIIYERKNVLARFSSSRLVKATGIYNIPVGRARPGKLDTLIEFNRKAFSGYLQKHNDLFAIYRHNSVGPKLEVSYQQIKEDGFGAVLDFLGVSALALTPQKEKLHGSSIIERFDPRFHKAIVEEIEAAGHPEWLTE